jgi:hypothetical protein
MRGRFATWILLTLILFVGSLYALRQRKEGFTNSHPEYVDSQLKRYNPIGISLFASSTEGSLGGSANPILNTVGVQSNTPLNENEFGIRKIIKKCEAVKTTDCSVFDNKSFADDCGVCLDIGTDSLNAPKTGGLVLLESDREYVRSNTHSDFIPNYSPTVGTCPANRLVSSKGECQRLKRELECEKSGSYNLKDCSQCYSDSSYSIVNSDANEGVVAGTGSLILVGNGILSYVEAGYSNGRDIKLSMETPYQIDLKGPETTRVSLSIVRPPDESKVLIAGYLTGETGSGDFNIDLQRLVLTDNVTGRKPRTSGTMTVGEIDVTKLNPGFGKDSMSLVLPMPFTFVDTNTFEATMCKDAPFVTKQASSEFLNSDPCYKKGSGPGKFSVECLQGVFLSNGCVETGASYPKNAVSSSKIMTNNDGTYRTLNDIAGIVYDNAVSTSTGVDSNGKKLSISEWSNASVFCTGKEITSPCDTCDKENGPLTPECLAYLWNNDGAMKTPSGLPSSIGPTYNIISMASSLFMSGANPRFCQVSGTMSPVDANGNPNVASVKYWQGQGGVNAVKAKMANIHKMANTPGITDIDRAPYVSQCYGNIKMAPRPSGKAELVTSDMKSGIPGISL